MSLFRKKQARNEIMDFLRAICQDKKYQEKIDRCGGRILLTELGKSDDKVRLYLIKTIYINSIANYPFYKIQLETKLGTCDNYDGYAEFDTGKTSCGMGGMYSIKKEYTIENLVTNLLDFKKEAVERLGE